MAVKTTRKELKDKFVCIGFGYCDIQNLLTYESAVFYNSGDCGWNFDGYIIESDTFRVCVTTGYRNIIKHDNQKKAGYYELVKKYETLAEKEPTKEGKRKLLYELIEKTLNY